MSPCRILVLYGTSYGQTAKIAERIRQILAELGHDVTLANAAEFSKRLSSNDFDGVMIGASVIAQGHQKSVERFVRKNLDPLNYIPSAFFSVSASAAGTTEKARRDAQRMLDKFLQATEWRPELSVCLAGAVNYTRYNWLLRAYMRWASKKGGGSTDTSRDHEYTDWAQVETLAKAFAEIVLESRPHLLAHQDR